MCSFIVITIIIIVTIIIIIIIVIIICYHFTQFSSLTAAVWLIAIYTVSFSSNIRTKN